jgi:hypothetical protein
MTPGGGSRGTSRTRNRYHPPMASRLTRVGAMALAAALGAVLAGCPNLGALGSGSADAGKEPQDGETMGDSLAASQDGGSPCANPHEFCEDFDEEGGAYSSRLGQSLAGATLAVRTDAFVSPPASLRVDPSTYTSSAYLVVTLSKSPLPSGIRCEEDLQVAGPLGNGDYVVVFQIDAVSSDPSVASYEVYAQTYSGEASITETSRSTADGGPGDIGSAGLPYTLADGRWHHVAMTMTLGATPNALVYVDGSLGATLALSPPQGVVAFRFEIGVDYAAASGKWDSHHDNAFCDWVP